MNGSEHLGCVRYEMTQREFRRRRGEKWSPSFISKFGKLASKLYREVYKKEPPYKLYRELYKTDLPYGANGAEFEPINLYPYGILVQAYRRLIAAGEQIGEPYREPDPALKLKEPYREPDPASKLKESYREPDPALKLKDPTEVARLVRFSFSHGRSKEVLKKKIAERLAKIAAGWLPPEPPEDDMEQDDEIY
jgi:hypothetical protein